MINIISRNVIIIIATIICLIVIVLCLIFSPDVIRAIDYATMTRKAPPKWQGVINIWQISSWRVAQSSKTLSLLDVAKRFEKENIGIYIEAENISYESYKKRIAAGEQPEMISFPAEINIDTKDCITLESYPLTNINQLAYEASDNRIVPWLSTSSLIMLNSEKATRKNINQAQYQNANELALTINSLPKNKSGSSYYGSPFSLIPIALSNEIINNPPLPQTPYSAYVSFVSKESNFLYASIWETYAMERLIARDKGFSSTIVYPADLPVFIWSQCICAFSQDEDKTDIIKSYITMVLSDKWQIKIADATASLPATKVDMDYLGVRREIMINQNKKMTIIPSLGIDENTIYDALSGDKDAKNRLSQMIVIE